jgi:hypothetical protein
MSYFKDADSAAASSPYNKPESCFGCGQSLEGPTVRHDGYLSGGKGHSLFLHRDCAFAMAQRMSIDAWKNRRDGKPMWVERP